MALAGILTRKLPHARLTVLERAHRDRHEGYGLDLDEWGQEASGNHMRHHWQCLTPWCIDPSCVDRRGFAWQAEDEPASMLFLAVSVGIDLLNSLLESPDRDRRTQK